MRPRATFLIVVIFLLGLAPNLARAQPAPTITVNGSTALLHELMQGEQAIIHSDEGSSIVTYLGVADCTGTGTDSEGNHYGINPGGGFTMSARAYLIANPSVTSDCVTVTWAALPPPALSVNGSAISITLTVGETATFLTDTDAALTIYDSADCTGPAIPEISNTYSMTPGIETVASARAHLTANTGITSGCLSVTWIEALPTTPPPLTINGAATDAVVETGESIGIQTTADAVLVLYQEANCTGDSTVTDLNLFATVSNVAATSSYQARLIANPSVVSPCLNATWTAPVETPVDTPTETPTETPTSTSGATSEPTSEQTQQPTEPVATSTAQPTDPPADPRPSDGDGSVVTSLPSTGSGSSTGSLLFLLVSIMVMVSAAAFARRKGVIRRS